MRGLILVAVGAAFLAAGGFIALRRARVERARSGRVTVPTVIAAFVVYLGPSVCSLLASWWSAWLLPLPHRPAYLLGGAFAVVGLLGYSTARREFHSLRRSWGMETDRLITTGPYAYSRNPQLLAWALVLLGAAIAGRSSAALALTAIYWVGCVSTIRADGSTRWNEHSARSTAGIVRPCLCTSGCHTSGERAEGRNSDDKGPPRVTAHRIFRTRIRSAAAGYLFSISN